MFVESEIDGLRLEEKQKRESRRLGSLADWACWHGRRRVELEGVVEWARAKSPGSGIITGIVVSDGLIHGASGSVLMIKS